MFYPAQKHELRSITVNVVNLAMLLILQCCESGNVVNLGPVDTDFFPNVSKQITEALKAVTVRFRVVGLERLVILWRLWRFWRVRGVVDYVR